MKLYVGNLPNNMTEDELTSEFESCGEIHSLKIITDRDTGKSRGFGFIEMPDSDAQAAIDRLDNADMQGRNITVKVANEKRQNNRRNY